MIRGLACFTLATACACASQGSSSPDVSVVPMSDRIVSGGGSSLTIGSSATTVGIRTDLAATPDAAFRALQAVYDDLKIPIADLSPTDRVAGNQQFKARRRIVGVPMQSYFDCGGTPGQPNAETFDIVITVMSNVTAARNDASTLTTRATAIASDPGHGQGNQLRCSTTGELEARIAKLVREKLATR
ncbi:MAG TPA: hypothetical protein VHE78_10835 [Gemmatimonadaceae bacterium]|nr:hypothetical protein [Gemmatimonadaceae bacterium]